MEPFVDPEVTERASSGKACLAGVGCALSVGATFQLTPAQMEVPANLSFKDQVLRHADIYDALTKALDDSQERKEFAKQNRDKPGVFDQYLAAEEDERNTLKFLAPYAIASGKAKHLKDSNYYLTKTVGDGDWSGEVCNAQGNCSEDVDPMVALLMMLLKAVAEEILKPDAFGPNNDLWKILDKLAKFVERPLGGPNSDLVKIRESILQNDQGEIAKLIRDPIKRPLEIVQNLRDSIIPKNDNGEVAKAIRDPIKCTIGHLWGGCD